MGQTLDCFGKGVESIQSHRPEANPSPIFLRQV